MTAIAIIHRNYIIEQLTQGRLLSEVAEPFGITKHAISKVLKSDPEYREAIEFGFHKRLDEAERAFDSAIEQVDVARARARFQSVAWRAEREFPETWGQRVEMIGHVDVRVAIYDARQRAGLVVEQVDSPKISPNAGDEENKQ